MQKLNKGYVRRCYGVARIDRIAAIGKTGGGLGWTSGVFGIQYLQAGELTKLRADGVPEISLSEMNDLYKRELLNAKAQQLALFD